MEPPKKYSSINKNLDEIVSSINLVGSLLNDKNNLRIEDKKFNFVISQISFGELGENFKIKLTENIWVLGSSEEVSHGIILRMLLKTDNPISVERLSLKLNFTPVLGLEQGFQSWSPVRIAKVADFRPERANMPEWVKGMYFSDPNVVGKRFSSDHYTVCKNAEALAVIGYLSDFNHFSNITLYEDCVVANAILDGITIDSTFGLDPIYISVIDSDSREIDSSNGTDLDRFDFAYQEYVDLWAKHSKARIKRPFSDSWDRHQDQGVELGWCSWYQYFAEVKPENVRAAIKVGKSNNFNLIQIDDGYQFGIGDWLYQVPEWENQLSTLAEEIRKNSMKAGIWTAPFLVGHKSRLFSEHPDWTVKDKNTGEPQVAMMNPNWGGFAYALDTTNDEVLEFLVATYRSLSEIGFNYHKIDFCYAAALEGIRKNSQKITRSQILRKGLMAVREGIKDDYLLGCGCPLSSGVGIVDAMRVSADTAPYFEERIAWSGFNEASPSAYNALVASVLRSNLHGRVFANDPDCILLRKTDTMLTEDQMDLILAIIGGVGNFEIISDSVDLLDKDDFKRLETIRSLTGSDGKLELKNIFNFPVVVDSPSTRLIVDLWSKTDFKDPRWDHLHIGYDIVLQAKCENMWAVLLKNRS